MAKIMAVPIDVMARYQQVTMSADIMFINKVAIFVSISHGIRFGTAEMIQNKKADTLVECMKHIRDIYSQRGFNVQIAIMDGEFEPIRGALASMGIALNATSESEHAPVIERYIRTVKERVRSTYNALPFLHYPPRLIVEMVYASVFWMNTFPPHSGASIALSPRTIITGQAVDYERHCQLEFGSYVQVHESHDNTMSARTSGALALRPSGNAQGGHYFYSLNTGCVLSRARWTPMPMPNEIITRVHALARRAHAERGLSLADRYAPGDDDEENDEEYHPDNEFPDDDGDDDLIYDANVIEINDEPDNNAHNVDPVPAGVGMALPNNNENMIIVAPIAVAAAAPLAAVAAPIGLPVAPPIGLIEPPVAPIAPLVAAVAPPPIIVPIQPIAPLVAAAAAPINLPADVAAVAPAAPLDPPVIAQINEPGIVAGAIALPAENAGVHELEDEMDMRYGQRNSQYNLRQRKTRNYSHLHNTLGEILTQKLRSEVKPKRPQDFAMLHNTLHGAILTQYSVKKGLEMFGEIGEEALVQELKQVHDMDVFNPKDPRKMTREEKKQALEYLMFLKQKKSGRVKARGCADGRKQRRYMDKEETSSPTVATESPTTAHLHDRCGGGMGCCYG